MELPPEFLRREDTPNDQLKAMTADGARLWVRSFDDPDDGALSFWSDAVREDLVENRGYEPVSRDDIRDGAGRAGVVQRYRTVADGAPHGYLIAVFAFDGTVRTVEFTAVRAKFELLESAVVNAITTLR